MRSTLAIYCASANTEIDATNLAHFLNDIQLISEHVSKDCYLAGSNFFNKIVFLGCAPCIPLTPDQGEDFLTISLVCTKTPKLYYADNAPQLKCPSCKQALSEALPKVGQHKNTACLKCNETIDYAQLNLRKNGYYARAALHVSPVFTSEAIPSEVLLNDMHQRFRQRFRYAYI